MKDSLGDRMKKNYEHRAQTHLYRRTPAIVRVDGRAFHTLTRNLEKPFDLTFNTAMQWVADALLKEIQGSKLVYSQSDEISVLFTDYDRLESEGWFDYNVQKMVSIAASRATVEFNLLGAQYGWPIGLFDARVFNLPKEEVENYFLWRCRDAERNALNSFCHFHFGHGALQGKNTTQKIEMLKEADLLQRFHLLDQNIVHGRLSTHTFGAPAYRETLSDIFAEFRQNGVV